MIGLDFASLFLDPVHTQATFFHEVTHGIIAESDFGQATRAFLVIEDRITGISGAEKQEMARILLSAQDFVQEGFATLMQMMLLGRLIGRKQTSEWAKTHLPDEYLDKLRRLDFVYRMSQKWRDHFTKKISFLAMETGIRKNAPSLDLFKNQALLDRYLKSENTPNFRLDKILQTLRYQPYLVTKPLPDIAAACGIEYHPPASKDDVAHYLTYLMRLAGDQGFISPSMIGDTPEGPQLALTVSKNLVVADMNLDLSHADHIFKHEDLLHYSDVIEAVMLLDNNFSETNKQTIKQISGEDADINVLAFRQTGEKIVSVLSAERAVNILAGPLRQATFLVNNGYYDFGQRKVRFSPNIRHPDVVVCGNAYSLEKALQQIVETDKKIKISYLLFSTIENHPFRILVLKIADNQPLLCLSTFGEHGIGPLMEKYADNLLPLAGPVDDTTRRHINNFMSVRLAAPWQVDWIKSMEAKTLFPR